MKNMLKRSFSGPSRCSMCLEVVEEKCMDLLLVHCCHLPFDVKDVLVTWRIRVKHSSVLGAWNMVSLPT